MPIKNSKFPELSFPFDHAALTESLQALEEAYPFLKVEYLTSSLLDRGIPQIKLGSGKRKLLYVGAHHGMEWITAAILVRFLWEAADAAVHNTRIGHLYYQSIFDTHTIFVIPMLNPDGVEYQIHGIEDGNPLFDRVLQMNGGSRDFSHWQANARGIDLNHNYDAGFEEYRSIALKNGIPDGAPTRCAGTVPESEPEVQGLCNFIRYHGDLLGVMTLHTQGREIYYRSGSTELARTRQIAQRLSRLTAYEVKDADGSAAYGGLTDWCVTKQKIPAFTLECGKGSNPLPDTAFPSLYREVREALFTFPILL